MSEGRGVKQIQSQVIQTLTVVDCIMETNDMSVVCNPFSWIRRRGGGTDILQPDSQELPDGPFRHGGTDNQL